jgi:hypothetical protein
VHNFATTNVNDISILGLYHTDLANPLVNINNVSNLHGAKRTIEAGQGDTGIAILEPPLAIFQWHYLQCVLQKFGTKGNNGLEGVQNIYW